LLPPSFAPELPDDELPDDELLDGELLDGELLGLAVEPELPESELDELAESDFESLPEDLAAGSELVDDDLPLDRLSVL
jgi:hypothetical protein